MPSFLSRIRHRPSNTQPPTHSAPTLPTPTSSNAATNIEGSADILPSALIGQRIRPDLDSLLESYEAERIIPKYQSNSGPATTPPSSILDDYNPLPLKPHVSRNVPTKSHKRTSPATPDSTTKPTFSISNKGSPLGGTFGRQQPPLTNLGEIGSGPPDRRVPARSLSFNDATNIDQRSIGAERRGRSSIPTSQLPLSGTFKGSSSVHSLPNKRRRLERRKGSNTRSLSSLKTNRSSSPATPRPNLIHRSSSRSPRTFGYPTPPYSTHTFGNPPPPLPPLDHLGLVTDGRGSRPVAFGKSHMPSNSAPTILHANNIFDIPQEPTLGPSVSRGSGVRKHSKTVSVDSRRSSRRSSAEWSSVQATEGVLTNSSSWQAQVSREMLRLSLGEPAITLLSRSNSGNNRDVSHVSAARHPPALALVSPRPPPSLGSPLFLQDSISTSTSSEFRGSDQAAVTANVHDNQRRMTEQGTPALQVANNPSDTKGKQPLKSSLRASSTPRYSAISSVLATPARSDDQSSDSSVTKGKRKADEVDLTPPDQRSLHAKFAVPEDLPLAKRPGPDPHAPSSFRAKRARLSASSSPGPAPSRPDASLNATNSGTWTSTTSSKIWSLSRQQSMTKPPSSKTNSYRSDMPSERVRSYERTRSMSQLSHTSIPVSALVSPRAPSVSKSMTSAYHMRDPRRPPRVQPTPWGLKLATEYEDGSPIHAWLFFLGFIIFPLWWVASVWRIPQTRSVGGSDVEKAVTLDDPQVEHDARTWRFRCRIMAGVSLITYIPFIVLVAIFAH